MRLFDKFNAPSQLGLEQVTPPEQAKLRSATRRAMSVRVRTGDIVGLNREISIDLESAICREPDEWVYYWRLAGALLHQKRYMEGVRMAENAFDIRPNDPRSTYGLGSAYRVLTRADYLLPKYAHNAGLQDSIRKSKGMGSGEIDPSASALALKLLSMSLEDAAERVAICFVETIALGLTPQEDQQVRRSLNIHVSGFPELVPLTKQAMAARMDGWRVASSNARHALGSGAGDSTPEVGRPNLAASSGEPPSLRRADLGNFDKVGHVVDWFLEHDSRVNQLLTPAGILLFGAGYRPKDGMPMDPDTLRPGCETLPEWFAAKVCLDLRELAHAEKQEFVTYMDILNNIMLKCLRIWMPIAQQSGLPLERLVWEDAIGKFRTKSGNRSRRVTSRKCWSERKCAF